MIERILLHVEDSPGSRAAAAWALDLASALSARVFAVCVIAAPPGRTRRDRSQVEEAAWGLLYEIEDDAFEQNVRVSLLLEQGEPLARLCDLCSSYHADIVVAGADCRIPAADLIRRCPRPVVFAKTAKED
ncbi:MAG: universal stress protein [candidate division WOR-3 bacterium]